MLTPKVIFKNISLSIEREMIHHFLFKNEWKWERFILQKHPKLKQIYTIKNENVQYKFLNKYIINFGRQHKKIIENNKKKYQKEWKKIEKEAFTALPEIIETDWPKRNKRIKAMISINPICPRFINDWSFSLFYKQKAKKMKETIMHEICHFLYFKKWGEVILNVRRKTLEYPYIEWHLSEILAPVILNDSRIKKLLRHRAVFYKEHQKIKINGINAPKYFSMLYKRYKKKRYGFDDFLKKAYSEIKQHKRVFNKL